MLQNDKPILKKESDKLNRSKFSIQLIDSILSNSSSDSFVIGLYGKWGYGKTSIINMSIEYLNEKELKDKPIVFNFNPWFFSGQSDLISQFFKQLANKLGKKEDSKVNSISTKLEKFSNILDFAKYIPYAKEFTEEFKEEVKSISKDISDLKVSKKDDIFSLKKEIEKELLEKKQKIIIVIDDIDRLQKNEIIDIFKLVKVVADFPYITYILLFEKEIIVNALNRVQDGDGEEYLEKIIQVPFEIPKLNSSKLTTIFINSLDKVLNNHLETEQIKSIYDTYFGNVYHSGIKYFFKTIRDINRFINVLNFDMGALKEEVNIIDLIFITSIKVFEPKFYSFIRENKHIFTYISSDSYYANSKDKEELFKGFIQEEFKRLKVINENKLKELLVIIFPNIASIFKNMSYGSDWIGEWKKNRRICTEKFFDRYFMLTLDDNELSEVILREGIEKTKDTQEFIDFLQWLIDTDKILEFLNDIQNFTEEDIPLENIKNVVIVMMDLGDTFPEKENADFWNSTQWQVKRINYQLLNRLDDDLYYKILKSAIEKAENSLYIPIEKILSEDIKHARYGYENKDENKSRLNEIQLDELEKIGLEKINKWNETKDLLDTIHFSHILRASKFWGGENEYNKFMENVINSNEIFIKFLTNFLSRGSSWSDGDYVENRYWRLDYDYLLKFIDETTLREKVEDIKENSYKNLNEKEKIAIDKSIDKLNGINDRYE